MEGVAFLLVWLAPALNSLHYVAVTEVEVWNSGLAVRVGNSYALLLLAEIHCSDPTLSLTENIDTKCYTPKPVLDIN